MALSPPLPPLIEGPDPEAQGKQGKKESSWGAIRTWVHGSSNATSAKRKDLKLMLGVLGCPLAPIPSPREPSHRSSSIVDGPIEASSAQYIVHQYLAAAGCAKRPERCVKSLYAMGTVRMAGGKVENAFKRNGGGGGGGESGCFVLWQMSPGMWLVELAVAGCKVAAGSDGRIVWRHLPWIGTHAARVPRRPLRRIIQGLDPINTASMFARAECIGEKRMCADDCFVLRVSADRATLSERKEGSFEVMRRVLYGYFSQRSGLLVYIEDSHLTRVQSSASDAIYWETTIGSSIEDYREVDGVLIAHRGRSVAMSFRFGEERAQQSRRVMEEEWRIDDVVFNVPGLSVDCFVPRTEVLSKAS